MQQFLCHAFIGVDTLTTLIVLKIVLHQFSPVRNILVIYLSNSDKRDERKLLQPPRNICKIGARESFQKLLTLFSSSIKKIMVCLVAKVGQHFPLVPEVSVQA